MLQYISRLSKDAQISMAYMCKKEKYKVCADNEMFLLRMLAVVNPEAAHLHAEIKSEQDFCEYTTQLLYAQNRHENTLHHRRLGVLSDLIDTQKWYDVCGHYNTSPEPKWKRDVDSIINLLN